jgi:alpha-amylase
LENLEGQEAVFFWAVEMNYNLLTGDAHDRYYSLPGREQAGRLGVVQDFGEVSWVGLKDHWLNLALTLRASVPARILVSPVRTVSNSEAGFESVYQSSAVVMQWPVRLAGHGRWRLSLKQEVGRVRS